MPNRAEFKKTIAELKEQIKLGPVEILSGPCAGIVVKDAESLREYSCRLDEWMFPSEPVRVNRQVASKPRGLTDY